MFEREICNSVELNLESRVEARTLVISNSKFTKLDPNP